MAMLSAAAAVLDPRFISISSREGVGSPEGMVA